MPILYKSFYAYVRQYSGIRGDLMGRKKEKESRCIVYLSTDGDINSASVKEKKQLRYIKEYAKAHNISVKAIYHRDILGQYDVNRHFMGIVRRIQNKEADGILLANMGSISTCLEDAYNKIGIMAAAGGYVVTVDEGKLSLPIKMLGGLAE